MPRKARLDIPGTLHHVMVRGIEKRKVFDDESDCLNFVKRMGDNALKTKTILYAWALMPNHIHILLRSGPEGLPAYMRRVLTGYAVTYNKRHNRHGHLFQNRYKSIVCDEDAYFMELVRYIHLNPLRAGLVKDLLALQFYPWCGHGVLLGRAKKEWQDCEEVLLWFGKKKKEAQKNYVRYVHEGIEQGYRPDLVGGGLVRSHGRWSQVVSMNKRGSRELADDRILGKGIFVENILKEASNCIQKQFFKPLNREMIKKLLAEECNKHGIGMSTLQCGNRSVDTAKLRSKLVFKLTRDYGVSLSEAARQLGITTSGVAKALKRGVKS
ncbi:transposase [bacterium]|nr:transposase [bacterium]